MTAFLLIVLDVLDLFFTLYALSLGYAEANPLLQNPQFMVTYKLTIVPLLACWLYRLGAKRGLAALALVYVFVNLWHVYGLFVR